MKYAEIHAAALAEKQAGEEFCTVVTFRKNLPSLSWESVVLGKRARYQCPGERIGFLEIERRPERVWGYWLFVKVSTQHLVTWSAVPLTATGDVPRVVRVVGFTKFNAEVMG